jgi:hypothetical protein
MTDFDIWDYGSDQYWCLKENRKIDEICISEALDALKVHQFGKVADEDMTLLFHAIIQYYHISHIQYIIERIFGSIPIPSDIMTKIKKTIQWKYIRLYYLLEDASQDHIFYKYYSDQLDTYAAHFGITYKKGADVLDLLRK